MRVLVIEDEEHRRAWFRERFADAHITADVDEAIAWLQEREYDALFLDHDLGEKIYAGSDEPRPGVGRDVAEWLVRNPRVAPSMPIVVHSMNAVAADKIHAALVHAGRPVQRVPFSVLFTDEEWAAMSARQRVKLAQMERARRLQRIEERDGD